MAKEKEVAASEKARQAQAQSSPARPSQSAERGMGRPQGETNRNNANVAASRGSPAMAAQARAQNTPGQAQQPMAQKPNTADKHLPSVQLTNNQNAKSNQGVNPNRPPPAAAKQPQGQAQRPQSQSQAKPPAAQAKPAAQAAPPAQSKPPPQAQKPPQSQGRSR